MRNIGYSFLNIWNTKVKEILGADFQRLGLEKFIIDEEYDTPRCIEIKKDAWESPASRVYKKNAETIILDWVEETQQIIKENVDELNGNEMYVAEKDSIEEFIGQLIQIYQPNFTFQVGKGDDATPFDHSTRRPKTFTTKWDGFSGDYTDTREKPNRY